MSPLCDGAKAAYVRPQLASGGPGQARRDARLPQARLDKSRHQERNAMTVRVTIVRLYAAGLTACALAVAGNAFALDYPTRPVRFIVGYPAGGSTDITARIIGQWLSERLGQQFIVENKPGAGNNIGTEAMIHSPPDGYTVYLVNPANAINATLYRKLSFNFIADSVPIAGFIRVPNVMEVTPSLPAKTVAEFITYAKANPGKINWATSGNGTSVHLSGELFKMMTGVEMTHIPYKGSAPALTDLIAGTVHIMFDNMPSSLTHIQAGKLRALGVTTATRSEALPDVPTVAETVAGYEASAFFGMSAPKGTPSEIVEKLNKEINAGLADARIKARLADLGGVLIAGTPADFGKVVAEETDKWAKVIKAGGVALE
jgi:tripartite-type tricarboxylate transporter receptor subunit TctC